jgi:hypothetical protein
VEDRVHIILLAATEVKRETPTRGYKTQIKVRSSINDEFVCSLVTVYRDIPHHMSLNTVIKLNIIFLLHYYFLKSNTFIKFGHFREIC